MTVLNERIERERQVRIRRFCDDGELVVLALNRFFSLLVN
jgi:hypothetical protein